VTYLDERERRGVLPFCLLAYSSCMQPQTVAFVMNINIGMFKCTLIIVGRRE
jgi:hypothetical protein